MPEDADENHTVYQIYQSRFGLDPEILTDTAVFGRKFYEITKSDFYLFDSSYSNLGQNLIRYEERCKECEPSRPLRRT